MAPRGSGVKSSVSARGGKGGLWDPIVEGKWGWERNLAGVVLQMRLCFQVMKREKGTRCWRDLAEGQMAVNQIPFLLMDGLIFAANFKFSWNGVSKGAGHSKVVYKSTLQSSNSGEAVVGAGCVAAIQGL